MNSNYKHFLTQRGGYLLTSSWTLSSTERGDMCSPMDLRILRDEGNRAGRKQGLPMGWMAGTCCRPHGGLPWPHLAPRRGMSVKFFIKQGRGRPPEIKHGKMVEIKQDQSIQNPKIFWEKFTWKTFCKCLILSYVCLEECFFKQPIFSYKLD